MSAVAKMGWNCWKSEFRLTADEAENCGVLKRACPAPICREAWKIPNNAAGMWFAVGYASASKRGVAILQRCVAEGRFAAQSAIPAAMRRAGGADGLELMDQIE